MLQIQNYFQKSGASCHDQTDAPNKQELEISTTKKTTQGDSFIKKIEKTEDYNMQLNIPNWDKKNEFSEIPRKNYENF